MLEALSLAIFAGVIYFCLVIVPSIMDFFRCEHCKRAFSEAKTEQ